MCIIAKCVLQISLQLALDKLRAAAQPFYDYAYVVVVVDVYTWFAQSDWTHFETRNGLRAQ